jgi:hypothetical protein
MLPPSPPLSTSQGCPHKCQAFGWITLWIAPESSPHTQVCLQDGRSWITPCRLYYRASNQTVIDHVPSSTL